MNFPTLPEATRLARLAPPTSKVRMVLDTDTYNEIDDQFAVVYALLSPEHMALEALYAAPFHNRRSTGPQHGMEQSYEEILRLLDKLGVAADNLVYRGSTGFLTDYEQPYRSPAALDLVQRAMASEDEPLYVVAIGAITNVASALLIEPHIAERIVVLWLGGHALYWPHTREFNLGQDITSARLVFDCGVPVVHFPCLGVTSHLHTTVPEIERYVAGQGAIGDYLATIFKEHYPDHYAWSKVLWDMVTIAYLINPNWVLTALVHSPVLTDQVTWSVDNSRHFIRSANYVFRDGIFRDFFEKLAACAS